MKCRFVVILLIVSNCLAGQSEIECLSIDFESLPGSEQPFEGLPLSEIYRDSFGLYFELEGGGVPVLAEVGFPRTAFGSAFGSDQPAAGQGIGQFFLTDDGVLSGLNSPPIIVRFDNPIDTFSGCILDMDFDELFIIHARDIDDQIMLADTIRAGDPGTGDGLSTCWGFNLPKCSGSVYSVRFEGRREASGSFGMGLDNLTFCTGVDINTQVSAETSGTSCNGLYSGTIDIINNGPGVFEFSIDGGPYQTEPNFEDLTGGEHTITLLESAGCVESFIVVVLGPEDVIFTDIIESHTSCEQDNGALEIVTNVTDSLQYSLDGLLFQSNPVFQDLAPGAYDIIVMDKYGCEYESSAVINPSSLPEIQSVSVTEDFCEEAQGLLSVFASGGVGELFYSINDQDFQADIDFSNLAFGEYRVAVRDEDGCEVYDTIQLESTPPVEIVSANVKQPVCQEEAGSITVFTSGGSGDLQYTIDGIQYQSNHVISDVSPGVYTLSVQDDFGCLDSRELEIKIPRCPIFVPNVFSPNNDGTNELFVLGTVDGYEAGIIRYLIFDRWGELVYEAGGFSISDRVFWWDGTFNGEYAEIGVYAYLIEIEHENKDIQYLTGDITLLR